MNLAIELVLPYARAYAAHAGAARTDSELRAALRAALGGLPWWGALFAVKGAVLTRVFGPYIFLRRPAFFEDLSPEDKDRLLDCLQFQRFLPFKGLFLAAKTVVLPCCYAAPERMRAIGYHE